MFVLNLLINIPCNMLVTKAGCTIRLLNSINITFMVGDWNKWSLVRLNQTHKQCDMSTDFHSDVDSWAWIVLLFHNVRSTAAEWHVFTPRSCCYRNKITSCHISMTRGTVCKHCSLCRNHETCMIDKSGTRTQLGQLQFMGVWAPLHISKNSKKDSDGSV